MGWFILMNKTIMLALASCSRLADLLPWLSIMGGFDDPEQYLPLKET